MDRKDKIEFLKGLAAGNRNIYELRNDEAEFPYDLMTITECMYGILHEPRPSHGPHISNLSCSVADFDNELLKNVPLRSHIETTYRGLCRCITIEVINYKDPIVKPITHVLYNFNNRSYSLFPGSEEDVLLLDLEDNLLQEYFEKRINEALIINPLK